MKQLTEKPKILITNDDGISAGGIRLLAQTAARFGDVTVVAPAEEQSAMSHGITVRQPLHVTEYHALEGIRAYQVTGKPADCVIMAMDRLGLTFDFVFSGINHGTNLGIDINYSGTVGAASEALLYGIPSAAFSSALGDDPLTRRELARVLEFLFEENLWHDDSVLNVNFPGGSRSQFKGIRITRQALSLNRPFSEGTDLAAWEDGFVSVTPIGIDRTRYDILNQWKEKKHEW